MWGAPCDVEGGLADSGEVVPCKCGGGVPMSDLREAALIAVRDCMGARSGEDVLVIMDKGTRTVGMALLRPLYPLGAKLWLWR